MSVFLKKFLKFAIKLDNNLSKQKMNKPRLAKLERRRWLNTKNVSGVASNHEALPVVAFNLTLVVQAFNPDAI